jgi:hypothetical protein
MISPTAAGATLPAMTRSGTLGMLATLAALLVACTEPGPPCPNPFVALRNPETLACVQRQTPGPACPTIRPLPAWPVCKHPCEAIRDEAACVATDGCRDVREDCDVFDDRCTREGPFLGCYPVSPAPPIEGDCATLDATACATRSDCGAMYLHGPECDLDPPPPVPASIPEGLGCRFMFVACFDELSPP